VGRTAGGGTTRRGGGGGRLGRVGSGGKQWERLGRAGSRRRDSWCAGEVVAGRGRWWRPAVVGSTQEHFKKIVD
jgi:hypothetical protein